MYSPKLTISQAPFNLQRLQSEINILLLSDLHYDKKLEKDKKVEGVYINTQIVQTLIELRVRERGNWDPDILIIAGDLVNQNQEESYEHLQDLLQKIIAAFPNLRYAVYFTPGNHDVDRNRHPQIRRLLSNFTSTPFPDITEKDLTNDEAKNRSKECHRIVESVSKTSLDTKGLAFLSEFEQVYFHLYLEKTSSFFNYPAPHSLLVQPDLKYPVSGISTTYFHSVLGITIVAYNSSFFCNLVSVLDDRNHLFLLKDLVDKTIDQLPRSGPVISFMHHPFYLLNDSEHLGPAKKPDGLKGDNNNNFTKILETSSLVLTGHVHGILHDPTVLLDCAHLVTNGATFTTDNYIEKYHPYTFALTKINKELQKFSLKKFTYYADPNRPTESERFHESSKEFPTYYDFVIRPGEQSTSLESERVRALYFFYNLENYYSTDLTRENKQVLFLVYQIKDYWKSFVTDNTKEITVNFSNRTLGSLRCICLELVADEMKATIILADNVEDTLTSITQILDSLDHSEFKENHQLFFSLDWNKLVDTQHHPITPIIETYKSNYRNLVRIRKHQFTCISLLYHQKLT